MIKVNSTTAGYAETISERANELGVEAFAHELTKQHSRLIGELNAVYGPKVVAQGLRVLATGVEERFEHYDSVHQAFEMFHDLQVSVNTHGILGETP